MGVLDVKHRVVIGALHQEVKIKDEWGFDRVPDQGVARRIDTDLIHEVLESDDCACALGELDLLSISEHLDHLTDEHLNIDVHVVTGTGGDCPEPVHVAVVVGSEQIDRRVKPSVSLVHVVRRIGREIGELPIGLDEHAVLVVTEVTRPQPHGTIEFKNMALLSQPSHPSLDRA